MSLEPVTGLAPVLPTHWFRISQAGCNNARNSHCKQTDSNSNWSSEGNGSQGGQSDSIPCLAPGFSYFSYSQLTQVANEFATRGR